VFEVLQDINRHGVSMLLIEQNVNKALEIARRAYVLENGRIVAEGRPADLLARPEIRAAYLGLESAEQ
jgi:branched-chain amino acid transport system ATP-binding protein